VGEESVPGLRGFNGVFPGWQFLVNERGELMRANKNRDNADRFSQSFVWVLRIAKWLVRGVAAAPGSHPALHPF
jgi:hypothetical protein